jgi:hypothetical protein
VGLKRFVLTQQTPASVSLDLVGQVSRELVAAKVHAQLGRLRDLCHDAFDVQPEARRHAHPLVPARPKNGRSGGLLDHLYRSSPGYRFGVLDVREEGEHLGWLATDRDRKVKAPVVISAPTNWVVEPESKRCHIVSLPPSVLR